jgi:hypothetical protein
MDTNEEFFDQETDRERKSNLMVLHYVNAINEVRHKVTDLPAFARQSIARALNAINAGSTIEIQLFTTHQDFIVKEGNSPYMTASNDEYAFSIKSDGKSVSIRRRYIPKAYKKLNL